MPVVPVAPAVMPVVAVGEVPTPVVPVVAVAPVDAPAPDVGLVLVVPPPPPLPHAASTSERTMMRASQRLPVYFLDFKVVISLFD
jgi:hypothetical protein